MSALAYAAIARASQGAKAGSRLFVDLRYEKFSSDIRVVESVGYSQYGVGSASYIADSLATAQLVADHPRFAFTDASGRHFRLYAPEGYLSVEQGGAKASTGINDQPAIQAAIDYAGAVAIEAVHFTQPRYELWAPVRTSPTADVHARDGNYLVVGHSLALIGAATERSVLDFRSSTGRSPETNWQDVGGAVWRGTGIFLKGDTGTSVPEDPAVDSFRLERLILEGNTLNTGQNAYPANPATGDGWDITHKGFRVQDSHVGDIALVETDILGWKGEMFYIVGYAPRSLRAERCRMTIGNANAWNVQVDCPTLVSDCEFGNCHQAAEIFSQGRAVYRNVTFRDCDRIWITGGRDHDPAYHYRWPIRGADGALPICELANCTLQSVGQALIGSYVHGSLTTVDSLILLDCNNLYAIDDCRLQIEAWIDRADGIAPLVMNGPASLTTNVPSSPAGTYQQAIRNTHVTLSCRRTAVATQNNHQWFAPQWQGHIEANCSVTIDHAELPIDAPMRTFDNPPLSFPLIDHQRVVASQFFGGAVAMWHGSIAANGLFTPRASLCATVVDDESTYDLHLPTAPNAGSTYGYVEGQRIRLYKRSDAGALRFVRDGHASFVVPATRVLDNAQDWIEFMWNPHANRWEEAEFWTSAAA